ncbi:hypothetical protein I302_102582 [Kwoniella bestiolae CBS 10118]|uniref:SAP domain-containing protein n=1 Tax=Kwoniella bestiolae CBS 10118 TaxID=1296100 RepID=A0A1B9GFH3_9TREE|nr:hypothetical protein I302_01269 [Kwoniella bestiolae CBS 10118]OCF29756.1 hypothetical protein I302_01269 [Kwoniella bestiolae CBS 10118]
MYFITFVASLAAIAGTQAAPLFGSFFHHSSTSPSNNATSTTSARFPSYTGGRFNLTEVLEEHNIDLSNLRNLNVTQILGEFGITLPSNIDVEDIIDDLEEKFNSTGNGNGFQSGSFFHHNSSASASAKPSSGFLGGLFGHHGHNKTSIAVSRTRNRTSTSASATPSVTSDFESSFTSSFSFSVPTPSFSASNVESFSVPSASASASASFGDLVGIGSEILPSATTSFALPSVSVSVSASSASVTPPFISTVTEEDAGIPGPTGTNGDLLDVDATVTADLLGAEVTADVNLDI